MALKLNEEQVVRLYNIENTNHQILNAWYLGDHYFQIETDKRTYKVCLGTKWTDFVMGGITLKRNEKQEVGKTKADDKKDKPDVMYNIIISILLLVALAVMIASSLVVIFVR